MFKLKVLAEISKYPVASFLLGQRIKDSIVRSIGVYQRPKLTTLRTDQLSGLRERLQKKVKPLSHNEWQLIREELMKASKNITAENVDAALISLCDPQTQLRTARSYLDFLKSEGQSANYATVGRILRMYYPAYQRGDFTQDDHKYILDTYRRMRQEHELLDESTCESLISALVVTSEWKLSLELFDMIKITGEPSVNVYSTIIAKAFESPDEWELGWKLLWEMCDLGKQPKCEIFIQYLRAAASLDPQKFQDNFEKLLLFIGDHQIIVSRKVINEICRIGDTFKIKSKIATLSKSGQCSACKKSQPSNIVTAKEFKQLSSFFMDKVLIRKDVFLKSLPSEVERFLKFTDKTAPYDCVIDGLNVAFSSGKKPAMVYGKILAAVVKHFKDKGKNILVLGRQHMNKWPPEQMRYIRQSANLFLTENLSHDDPFLLYATIKSGPHADFVSRDLMRTHAHLLGPELKPSFRKWQQEHQYMVVTATDQGRVIIKSPIKYALTASKIGLTWHVPFREEYTSTPAETFDAPQSWLCLSFDSVIGS